MFSSNSFSSEHARYNYYEDDSLWLKTLSQIETNFHNKLPSSKAILMLGDDESGKHSLIAKLQGKVLKRGSGLEYTYIYVQDKNSDEFTHLDVWMLDGTQCHENLLKFVLNEDTFNSTTIILTATMTEPWLILESLQNWAFILNKHIDKLNFADVIRNQHKEQVLKRFQEYVEPCDTMGQFTSLYSMTNKKVELADYSAYGNLGLDIIVVITKTDYMSNLYKDYDYKNEHFDFIQQAIRKFCLNYYASLVYVSAKDDKNCDLLFNYLVHRIYSFPFSSPAQVSERDSVFIPSGWDNDRKISILCDNFLDTVHPDEIYSNVIVKPIYKKFFQKEIEVECEDNQSFLLEQQVLLQRSPAKLSHPFVYDSSEVIQKTLEHRRSNSPSGQASPKKKVLTGGEQTLQNYFQGLLKKAEERRNSCSAERDKTTATTVNSTVLEKAARHDAVVELNRMTRSRALCRRFRTQQFSPTASDDDEDEE